MTWLILIGASLIFSFGAAIFIYKQSEDAAEAIGGGAAILICFFFLGIMGTSIYCSVDKGIPYENSTILLNELEDNVYVINKNNKYFAYYTDPTGTPYFIEEKTIKIYTNVIGEPPMVSVTEYHHNWWCRHFDGDKVVRTEYTIYLPSGDLISYRGG